METLVSCDACGHGAVAHEPSGCTVARCRCEKSLSSLIDEALEAAKSEIRREWHLSK